LEGEERKEDRDRSEGVVSTLDGEIAGDSFAANALNYQILFGKIHDLFDRLKLDA
jgi:ankyrin repeat/BTB/POZ domain-containing protein 1